MRREKERSQEILKNGILRLFPDMVSWLIVREISPKKVSC
jgi:hypothetical protein